ncbi:MAG: rod shape-determining protein MreD [Albidovulum sp.]|jgi:rod shape-determining protein MreD
MVESPATRRLGFRALFIGIAAIIIFFRILPLSTLPPRWPGPELLLCLTVVWVLRRPDYVPALLIAGVFLIDDLLALRPPGLWALIVLLGTEFLRSRENSTRDLPFFAEWMMAGGVIAVMTLANSFVHFLFMIPQASFAQVSVQLVATLMAYPFLALAMQLAFGLRRAATGEVDALGQRL